MQEQKKEAGLFKKLKASVDDKEEQLSILSTFVRLGILIWSGGILTLAYIQLPAVLGIPEQKLDPTFIASVFTGVLATFGVQATSKKNGNGATDGSISKEDLERLIEATKQTAPSQKIEIEHRPIKIITDNE